ncbi:hypothetical protein CEXT_659151 [Caerostris extrusa]|uniref:Uncharacterized protein n=1 Tax=Caerostris extrusa TaxID=172846 RepID=A0AAV4RIH8_CAEEX|nr:hypothetical protein CEXT_659151 [Caerostris extrusa]
MAADEPSPERRSEEINIAEQSIHIPMHAVLKKQAAFRQDKDLYRSLELLLSVHQRQYSSGHHFIPVLVFQKKNSDN